MFKVVMMLISAIMILAGVILIYDARLITKKFFGFGDQNLFYILIFKDSKMLSFF